MNRKAAYVGVGVKSRPARAAFLIVWGILRVEIPVKWRVEEVLVTVWEDLRVEVPVKWHVEEVALDSRGRYEKWNQTDLASWCDRRAHSRVRNQILTLGLSKRFGQIKELQA